MTLRVAPTLRSRFWCQSICGFGEKKLDSLSDCGPPSVCSWQQEATQTLHANGITAKKKQTAIALNVLAHALCSLTVSTVVAARAIVIRVEFNQFTISRGPQCQAATRPATVPCWQLSRQVVPVLQPLRISRFPKVLVDRVAHSEEGDIP